MAIRLDTTPFWSDTTPIRHYAPLDADERADVVVVGSGITGLTAAYLCASAGASVVVLERETVAAIDTGHTSAHLTMVTDTRLSDLVDTFGEDHARAVWDAGLAAIAQIEGIIREEDIRCDFRRVPGYLHAAAGATAEDLALLEREAQLADTLGFDATFVAATPLVGRPGIRFEQQARFHAGKYGRGLAEAIIRRGGRIYERSAVQAFVESPRGVTVRRHRVTADAMVVATHTPLIGERTPAAATLFQTKLALYSTYVVAGLVPKGTLPDVLLWDTGTPYHYYRLQPDSDDMDVVMYGGGDHKTGQVEDTVQRYQQLESALSALVPGATITHRWSGQVVETADGLPYIGEIGPREFTGTGYSGNGMTFGTLAGMFVHDAWTGRTHPWRDLFDPGRTVIRGGVWDYLAENKDYPYYLVRDRFAGVESRPLRSVAPGTARILARDGKPTAIFRDKGGALTMCSALCTHMGCLVAWNAAERTWDCPCHGSRFTPEGAVIAGPAERPLEPVTSRSTQELR